MSPHVMLAVLGLFAAASYGVADFFGARASKHLGPLTSAFCVQAIGLLVVAVVYAVAVHAWPDLSASSWVLGVIGATLFGLGACFLYLAFEIGPVSLASPLAAAYPLVTLITGVVLFGIRPLPRQWLGILLVVAGVLAALGIFSIRRGQWRLGRGPLFALLATLSWGLGFPLLDRAVDQSGWQTVTLVQCLGGLVVTGVATWLWRRSEGATWPVIREALRDRFIVGAGVMQVLAGIAINIAFGFDDLGGALVVALSATYPAITMALALRHFDEKLDRRSLAGAAATILGVVVLLA
jgi:drug/metabolite transporter (DMT)-like permease